MITIFFVVVVCPPPPPPAPPRPPPPPIIIRYFLLLFWTTFFLSFHQYSWENGNVNDPFPITDPPVGFCFCCTPHQRLVTIGNRIATFRVQLLLRTRINSRWRPGNVPNPLTNKTILNNNPIKWPSIGHPSTINSERGNNRIREANKSAVGWLPTVKQLAVMQMSRALMQLICILSFARSFHSSRLP